MIIIGGRKCSSCGLINPRKSMLKLTIWRSEWADSFSESIWLCNRMCLAKFMDDHRHWWK